MLSNPNRVAKGGDAMRAHLEFTTPKSVYVMAVAIQTMTFRGLYPEGMSRERSWVCGYFTSYRESGSQRGQRYRNVCRL